MPFTTLQLKSSDFQNKEDKKTIAVFEKLLSELGNRTVPASIEAFVNECIERINNSVLPEKKRIRFVAKQQTLILQRVEKELKWVPKNHYRFLFMLFGMSGIGVPIGVSIGFALNNMGLLGTGFPIGMAIGFTIGIAKDKKAAAENRQLNLDVL